MSAELRYHLGVLFNFPWDTIGFGLQHIVPRARDEYAACFGGPTKL